MLVEEITYTDYDGVERTEEFRFNLTRAEITEMEFTYPGGLAEEMERVLKSKDPVKLFVLFKDIIGRSYGEKSPDGRRFVKSEEITKAFFETPAYDQLYMRMTTDAHFAAEFVKGILPLDTVPEDEKAELLKKFEARIEEKRQ